MNAKFSGVMKCPYSFSTDYTRLKQLLDEGCSVICTADHDIDGQDTLQVRKERPLCTISYKYSEYGGQAYGCQIYTADRIVYNFTNPDKLEEGLMLNCKRLNVAFIDPMGVEQPSQPEERMRKMAEVCQMNDRAIAGLNKAASMSRRPMSKKDRLRVHYLKQSNSCLRQAEYYIIQAMAK